MRKLTLAAILTIALAATADAHAAVAANRPSGPSMRDRIETPITRIVKKLKHLVGIGTQELPSDPIPK
jgi:hypothetical protein